MKMARLRNPVWQRYRPWAFLAVMQALALMVLGAGAYADDVQIVSGFAEIVQSPYTMSYPAFHSPEKQKAHFLFRSRTGSLAWKTGIPAQKMDTIFVFIGGNHHPGQYELKINGTRALTFRSHVSARTLFCGEKARLLFDCLANNDAVGYTGLYYLRVPGAMIEPGKPLVIEVAVIDGEQPAWFAIWDQPGAVDIHRREPKAEKNVAMCNDFFLSAPEHVAHSLGVEVPLEVNAPATEGKPYSVEMFMKTLFSSDFATPLGARPTVNEGKTAKARFTFKDLNPDGMIYVFRATVAQDGAALLNMERDVLVGESRASFYPRLKESDFEPYVLTPSVKLASFAFLKPGPWPAPLKVHFITYLNSNREILEIFERLDMTFSSSPVSDLDCRQLSSRYVEDLRRHNPECLVIGSRMHCNFIGTEVKKEILTRVSEGMGLVCVGVTFDKVFQDAMSLEKMDAAAVLRGIPFEQLPNFKLLGPMEKRVSVARFGKGIIVNMDYTGYRGALVPEAGMERLPGETPRWFYYPLRYCEPADPFETTPEYTYAFLARAIAYASGRESKDRIARVQYEVRDNKPSAVVTLESAKPGQFLRMRVRDRFGTVVMEKSRVPAGKETCITLEGLNSGLHYADVILEEGERIQDFFVTAFENTAGALAIRSLKPTKPWLSGDEAPELRITWLNRGTAETQTPCGVSIKDIWGRTLVREKKTFNIPPGEKEFVFTTARPDTEAGRLFRVSLLQSGEALRADCFVSYPDAGRTQQEFDFHFWGAPLLQPQAWSKLAAENGFSAVTMGQMFYSAAGNLRVVDDHYLPLKVQPDTNLPLNVRPKCLDNPQVRKECDQLIDDKVRPMRVYGPAAYSLGHEANLTIKENATSIEDYCFCPYTLERFRAAMQRKYKKIKTLNEAWGTQFAGFQDVMPKTFREMLKDRKNMASWMDHRQFMDDTWRQWLTDAAERIRSQDPMAKVGYSGFAWGSFSGCDPYLLSKNLDYFALYMENSDTAKMLQAFRQPGGKIHRFTGYDYAAPSKTYNLSEPWRALFRGFTGLTYYLFSSVEASGVESGFFHPDMRLSTFGLWFGDAVKAVNEGPGMLLFDKRIRGNGIALYHSQRSVHVASGLREDVSGFTLLDSQFLGWMANVERYGLWTDCVSAHQVEADPAILKQYRILILPGVVSVSQKEMRALETFVDQGGMVVLDPLFGLYDERGHFRPDGVSAWFAPEAPDLFDELVKGGIGLREGTALLPKGSYPVRVNALSGVRRSLKGGKNIDSLNFEDKSLLPQVAGVGRGRIFFLPFFQPGNSGLALWDRTILDGVGLDVFARVEGAEEELVDQAYISHFEDGEKHYLGILYKDPYAQKESKPAVLKMSQKRHLYDVRQRKYMGETNSLPIVLNPQTPFLFCALPARIVPCSVKVTSARVKRGDRIRIQIAQPQADIHPLAYRVQIEDATGRKIQPYIRKIWAGKNTDVSFPVAFDDPVGRWKAVVMELISGESSEAGFDVVE